MAEGVKAEKSNVIQFMPKRAKTLSNINKNMPNAGKRRISHPVFIVPMKLKECAFRGSCKRRCMEPDRASFTEEIEVKLRLEAEYWLRLMNKLRHPNMEEFKQKNRYAREATWIMNGTVIPVGGQKRGGVNCVCGDALSEDGGMKQMQVFNNAQMREALWDMEMWADLTGGYVSVEGGQVSGLHQDFAALLGAFANLQLPYDDSALKMLMLEGGLSGIRAISRMASEPTVPHDARMKYLWAMDKLVSCAVFRPEGAEIVNDYIALGLSRFNAQEMVLEVVEGAPICWMVVNKDPPPMEKRPRISSLREMVAYSMSEFFQAVINMSARIDEIGSSSFENRQQHREAAQSIYAGLEEALRMLAGKDQPNKEMLWELCKKKAKEYQWEELHPGEQATAKYLLRKMWGNDELDTGSVDAMLEVLNAEDIDAEKYIRELGLE